MNAREYMIVDLERKGDKRMFITEQVSSIQRNEQGLWTVVFGTSRRVFRYNPARLLCLTNPTKVDIRDKGLYVRNKRIRKPQEVLCFSEGKHTFYRVTNQYGCSECVEEAQVYITRTPIDKNGGSTWDYLKKLAEETGLRSEDEEQEGDAGMNSLSEQYGWVDVKRDNVPLAQYLGDKRALTRHKLPKVVYFPFGCNASQKAAVEAALTHQVSVVQGPPGTGKTQTILNIIANLLLANKTVMVVSNNNSAVANVVEKLEREGLGFLVATLGNSEKRDEFVRQQQLCYPDMSAWKVEQSSAVKQEVQSSLAAVSQGFDDQTQRALLQAELDALLTEKQYNDQGQNTSEKYDGLKRKPSAKLLQLLLACKMKTEREETFSLWQRMKWAFTLGTPLFAWLKEQPSLLIAPLESAYYEAREGEICANLARIDARLQGMDVQACVKRLQTSSLQPLKHQIEKRYAHRTRPMFSQKDIRHNTEALLQEYPVVLSTTYSAKRCLSPDLVFDYVIMDEASQVDIKTGALALSCAMNAVIVGDTQQLPQVVDRTQRQAIEAILSTYQVEEPYNAATHSFLQSCLEVFKDAPVTLLREHYRCHPKIIEFCNQRFYGGQLIAMTHDTGEEDVLRVVRTVKGNHDRTSYIRPESAAKGSHINLREVEVIRQEVMPLYAEDESVGIITPYRDQAWQINRALQEDLASTVHKYQGRECDTIIMSMVDSVPTPFSDDAQLLNVAVSRAKSRLCIVVSGNEIPHDSNLGQLIAYVDYHNFEIRESKLHSVFDLLYEQYTAERIAFLEQHPPVSEHLSETLVYYTLQDALSALSWRQMGVLCHYPLSRLIGECHELNEQERAFAHHPLSHLDFLVYNVLTHQPLLAIEVDGWHYHQQHATQSARDELKNEILAKVDLPLHRLSTTDIVTLETMMALLQQTLDFRR